MNVSFNNLKKPSHPKLKRIADYLLFTGLPALNIFFVAIQPVSPIFTIWAIAVTNFLIALFKGATKFTVDENFYADNKQKTFKNQ